MNSFIRSILLVDDSENDVKLIKSALEEAHFGNDIVVAEDGEEALDYLYKKGKYASNSHEDPIFILLDIKMPMMDGIEVLKIIRADGLFKSVPIIMLTSSRDTRDLQKCYELGANSFVVKPINIIDFISVVRDIGKYWIVVNENPV
jgi:CheY-like chemotaxis protein